MVASRRPTTSPLTTTDDDFRFPFLALHSDSWPSPLRDRNLTRLAEDEVRLGVARDELRRAGDERQSDERPHDAHDCVAVAGTQQTFQPLYRAHRPFSPTVADASLGCPAAIGSDMPKTDAAMSA